MGKIVKRTTANGVVWFLRERLVIKTEWVAGRENATGFVSRVAEQRAAFHRESELRCGAEVVAVDAVKVPA